MLLIPIYIIYMLSLFVFLLAGALIILRQPACWPPCSGWRCPLALTTVWRDNAAAGNWTWFLWVKTWSGALACAWFSLCVAWSKISTRLAAATMWAFLALNIAEAVAKDALEGHWLNALAGALLIAAVLPAAGARSVVRRMDVRVIAYDLPWIWILGYTVWNSCFTYLFWHGYPFGQHLAVVGAALALALILGRMAWLHERALTLGLYLVVYNSFAAQFGHNFDTSPWQHPTLTILFQIASLGVAIAACAVLWRQRPAPAPASLGPGQERARRAASAEPR